MRDGSQMEVKIEYVDQLHSKEAGKGGAGPADQHHAHPHKKLPGSARGFMEEKQKFISEAQSWSRQVDTELARKKKAVTSSSIAQVSSAGPLPLGLFSSRLPGHASLSSKFSQEEQEKLLRQHFEQIQQQLISSAAPPSLTLSPAPLKPAPPLPPQGLVSSASVSAISMATPGGPHHPGAASHPSPKHSSGSVPSPKKSPVNPFHTAAAAAATPTMFPFLNQGALHSTSGAGFMTNPLLSQYQAAMLNPLYQAAALQQLMSSQAQAVPAPQSTKPTQQPVLVSDPSILHSLVDKLPIFMPDGSITFIPTTTSSAAAAAATPPTTSLPPPSGQGAATGARENGIVKEEGSPASLSLNLPTGAGGRNHKRIRSPMDGGEVRVELRGPPPKRRRSSSLPDITQIPPIPATLGLKEGIKEEEDVEVGVVRTRRIPAMSPAHAVVDGGVEPRQQQHRQLAPPTMIHIPQDVKINDPMMGFPTPPQSSPLVGNFALSPIVLSSATFHSHQPMTPVTPNQESLVTEELRELVVEAGGVQTTVPPSPEGSNLPPCEFVSVCVLTWYSIVLAWCYAVLVWCYAWCYDMPLYLTLSLPPSLPQSQLGEALSSSGSSCWTYSSHPTRST